MYTNPRVPDSTVTNKAYAERAVELGHGIISSCEHGYQGRYIEAYELHKEYNLKCLIGAEAYWVKDRKEADGTNCHIFLGAMNENGRRSINRVLSEANLTGFYRQARVDPELILSLPKDDVIVTSACVAFWRYEDVDSFVEELRGHFGDHFFLEVQYHNTDLQKDLNSRILRLHDSLKIPIIMGCDSHYITSNGGKERQDFLQARGMEYPDEKGWYLDYPDGDTAYDRFLDQGVLSQSQIQDAMDNTSVFLNVEEYDCPCFTKDIKCPTLYPGYTSEQKNAEYEKLVYQGWENYKSQVPEELYPVYEAEIKKEVEEVKSIVIKPEEGSSAAEFCAADYFVDDYYIVKRAIENGGVITPTGRGSGVSYFTNKLLGFTEVDRIAAKVKMYPERFMSSTRIMEAKTLPDLDLNVADQEPFARAQQDILGEDHAYPMIAYGTSQASAAWKLYAKSQGVDFITSNEVSKRLKRYEDALKHAEGEEKDLVDIHDYIELEFMEIFEKSSDYRGMISSWSIAPCSYLLYQGSIPEEIGLVRIKGNLCCLMDGHWAEKYKFLKNDLLKVKVVDTIDRIYQRIGRPRHTVSELLKECGPENKVWDIYRKGCTVGVNQVEQPGTSVRVGKYAPSNISELCAFIAAIRPGFKSMYKQFENREDFSYGIKSLDDLIRTEEMPQSYILYQEMSMAVLNYAGIDMRECYEIIKNIAKKRVEKVLGYKERFISGMELKLQEEEGLFENEAEKVAHDIWKILEDSSRYAFNACVPGDTVLMRPGHNPEISDTTLPVGLMYEIATSLTDDSMKQYSHIRHSYHTKGYGIAYSMFHDNRIYINDIKSILPAGNRVVYRIATENGCWFKCTSDHKFPTPDGIKRAKELKEGMLLYTVPGKPKRAVKPELSPVTSIDKLGREDVYDIVMSAPAHNFINTGGIVAMNSHSYCVAIDSLYGAYLKTFYPLEFYETYLRIQEESGDKDKMAAAKLEAEKYFKIKFPPFKFGQDNRQILLNEERREITNSITSIKGFGKQVGQILYEVSREKKYDSFMELCRRLSERGIKSKIEPLIKIDYFSEFGNANELLQMLSLLEFFKFGEMASIKKSKITSDPIRNIVSKYSTGTKKNGEEALSFSIKDMDSILRDCEALVKSLGLEDFSRRLKIQDQEDILGYFSPTGKEEDRPVLLVKEVSPLVRKADHAQFGYSYFCRSIGSGIETRFTVTNKVAEQGGLAFPGDIIKSTKRPSCNKGFWRMEEYVRIE